MATVNQIWRGESGEIGVSGNKGVKRYTDVYQVIADSETDDIVTVADLAGLPQLFDLHASDPDVRVRNRSFSKQDSSRIEWEARISYSNEVTSPEDQEDNPLAEPARISWGTVKVERPAILDTDGNLILMSNGLPPDPPLVRQTSHVLLRITRNEPDFDGATALNYIDHINTTEFSGGASKKVRCNDISAEEQHRAGVNFWVIGYEFEYAPENEAWDEVFPNVGYVELSGGEVVRIKDKNNQDVSEPWPLDENGAKVDAGDLPGGATFQRKQIYDDVDFNQLGLPV